MDFDAAPAGGQDHIDLSALGITFADLTVTTVAGGTQVAYGADTIVLQGVNAGGDQRYRLQLLRSAVQLPPVRFQARLEPHYSRGRSGTKHIATCSRRCTASYASRRLRRTQQEKPRCLLWGNSPSRQWSRNGRSAAVNGHSSGARGMEQLRSNRAEVSMAEWEPRLNRKKRTESEGEGSTAPFAAQIVQAFLAARCNQYPKTRANTLYDLAQILAPRESISAPRYACGQRSLMASRSRCLSCSVLGPVLMPPCSLQRAAAAPARRLAGFPCRTGEGATGLPPAVRLAPILRDQEVERAGLDHRLCALLRAEKGGCVRHQSP